MSDEGFSLEDIFGEAAKQPTTQPKSPVPAEGITPEEAHGYLPAEKRGVLSAAPEDTAVQQALKYIGTGATKMLSHVPGIGGDIGELADFIVAYPEAWMKDVPTSEIIAKRTAPPTQPPSLSQLATGERTPVEDTALSKIRKAIEPPSGADIQKYIFGKTGEYKPTSGMGKAGMVGMEAMTPIPFAGPQKGKAALGAGETVWQLLREMVPGFVAGSSAEAVTEATGSPIAGTVAGLVGGTAAGTVPTVLEAAMSPDRLARTVAGQTVREAAQDPDAVQRALDIAKDSRVALLPSVRPTVEQVVQDPGVTAMYEQMARDKRLTPEGTTASALAEKAAQQEAASVAAVQTGAESAASKLAPDMTTEYGLSGTAPRQMASTEARKIFTDLEADADRAVDALWKDPKLAGTAMYKNRALSAVDDYLGNLTTVRKGMIPKEITDTIDTIRAIPGRDVPIAEIQDLRSRVLAESRKAFRSGDNFTGGQLSDFGKTLADVINDEKNIVFGDRPTMPRVTPPGGMVGPVVPTGSTTAREAWQKAVDATREYHKTFNEGWLKGLNRDIDSGIPKISLDSTFDNMLSGKNATQNLDQLRNATKNAIDPHVSDYMIASLTQDGSKIVSPKDVDAWLARGTNAAVVDKVPGLRDRINNIRQASVSNQLSQNLARYADEPEKIVKMFEDNRSLLNTAIPASERAYFDALEASAKKVQSIPASDFANLTTLNKLAKGSVADLLYGVASGKITKGLMGIAAVKGAGYMFPSIQIGPMLEAITGVAGTTLPPVSKMLDRLATGNVRDRAIELLQQAKTDPVLFEKLMGSPDPRVLADMFLPTTARGAVMGAREGEANREGRATGGSVKSAEHHADSLVAKVDEIRKSHNSKTKENLNKPDEVVIAALKVANQST